MPPATGSQATCSFTATESLPPQTLTDTVEACGTDSAGHTNLCGKGSATVTVDPAAPTVSVSKSLVGLVCSTVRYSVGVTNTDPDSPLTLTALTDNVFGSITSVQGSVVGTTCGVSAGAGTLAGQAGAGTLPATIAINGSYTCNFDASFCDSKNTDTVTATAQDQYGQTVKTASPSVTVNVTAQ